MWLHQKNIVANQHCNKTEIRSTWVAIDSGYLDAQGNDQKKCHTHTYIRRALENMCSVNTCNPSCVCSALTSKIVHHCNITSKLSSRAWAVSITTHTHTLIHHALVITFSFGCSRIYFRNYMFSLILCMFMNHILQVSDRYVFVNHKGKVKSETIGFVVS